MRWRHLLWWVGTGILALFVLALIGAGVPFSYSCCGGTKDDVFRVVPGSLAAAVTAAGVVIGLGQYILNSHERRVERSMVFWQRSNTVEFTKHLTPYLKHLWKLDNNKGVAEFQRIARRPDKNKKWRRLHTSIEYLLDFYDEACSGVVTGACDEKAMHYYLGGVIVREWRSLAGYVQVCLKKYQRREKWIAFLEVAESWAKGHYVTSLRRIRT